MSKYDGLRGRAKSRAILEDLARQFAPALKRLASK
jgi:hypothetical protein